MRRTGWLFLLGVAVGAPALAAQDTMPVNPRRAEQLRQMIEQRFSQRVREALGLNG